MIARALAATAYVGFLTIATLPAAAQSRIEVGVLNCNVAGGTGFIIGSTKRLDCVFKRAGRDERYTGTINKFGIDIGQTTASAIAWAVFAPSADIASGALAGDYGGISGEATVGVGVGANALLGGSTKTIALQPLSVQSQQGLNIAAGIAALNLQASR
jgi:Protein of unknown function (DUF992)